MTDRSTASQGSVSVTSLSRRLRDVASLLVDTGDSEVVCAALEHGRLCLDSTGTVRSVLASGNSRTEDAVRALQEVWRSAPSLPATAWALALRATINALVRYDYEEQPQVVWTGPSVPGSYLRATREVVLDLLSRARREILIVGYWIGKAGVPNDTMERIVEALVAAAERGLEVTLILDERRRPDGRDNREALLDAWPTSVPQPRLLTWELPTDDAYLKLHAKVIGVDGSAALVTSANLTSYAMERNMEMGVLVMGTPASWIVDHFRRLIRQGIIGSYPDSPTS